MQFCRLTLPLEHDAAVEPLTPWAPLSSRKTSTLTIGFPTSKVSEYGDTTRELILDDSPTANGKWDRVASGVSDRRVIHNEGRAGAGAGTGKWKRGRPTGDGRRPDATRPSAVCTVRACPDALLRVLYKPSHFCRFPSHSPLAQASQLGSPTLLSALHSNKWRLIGFLNSHWFTCLSYALDYFKHKLQTLTGRPGVEGAIGSVQTGFPPHTTCACIFL